ncbi:PdaC/SigV domain-containing protein [Asticcacaulis solisilvae]|uniref:PdaC/SigV domain-containing protein n=1 Tax=Asticcacaulis solisilvae TaxID=1217274 RepID=UPI003FD7AAA8
MGAIHKTALAAAVAAAALTLNACDHKPKPQGAETGTPSAAPPELTFSDKDADAAVTLTLPEAVKAYPELHSRLYSEGKKELTGFLGDAHKDRAQQSADGIEVPAYSHTIAWKISAETPKLVSAFAQEDDFRGGAHPNSTFQAVLWDRAKKQPVAASSLFAPGADMKAVDAYVCHQIEAERSKRLGEPTTQAGTGFTCPTLSASRLILVASTVKEKAGAVDALFAPYEVGPYVEGPYEIRVPQALLKGVLNPDYADQFAGEPVKDTALPDLTQ